MDAAIYVLCVFVYWSGDHRYLPVLTHSFPTRRSSDLRLQLLVGVALGQDLGHGRIDAGVGRHVILFSGIQPQDRLALLAIEAGPGLLPQGARSEEHTSELQSLMRISYSVFCLKKKQKTHITHNT